VSLLVRFLLMLLVELVAWRDEGRGMDGNGGTMSTSMAGVHGTMRIDDTTTAV